MIRKEVYMLVDEERDYQDDKWGSDLKHSVEEWLIYIEDYVNETKHLLSRNSFDKTYEKAKCNLRKITALGFCAMEQHDCMSREEEEESKK